ncbi:MAG: SusD/RagB family nutrient-binding outer membrane lipoprotein [Sphingobacterium thalpophilum]
MKNHFFRNIAVVFIMFFGVSCDKGFEELNVNPNAATSVVPEFLLTKAQLSSARYDYFMLGGAMQHMANYNIGQAQGDKYVGNLGWQSGLFESFYIAEGLEIEEVIRTVSTNPDFINKLAVARIWRAYTYHRITDMYGDIPYKEAAKGASSKIYKPKYDKQSDIYADMLKELDEAAKSFNTAKPTFGSADLVYGGNIPKWQKFAYSLMLRLGMRLSKIDPAMSESWVKKAIAGGVIINDSDMATIQYIEGGQISNRNPIAQGLMEADYNTPQAVDNRLGGKLAKTLIDHLKNTKDPRLNALAVVWVRASPTSAFVADTATALQSGMQNGIWDAAPANFGSLSEPNPNTLLRYNAPMFMFTASESNLLLAEAAIRGWFAGNAEDSFNIGVRSGIQQWGMYGPAGVIATNRIDAYLKLNGFKTTGTFNQKLEQISTQKWVGLCFIDEYEVFSTWRRTGYPALVPVNYPGNLSGGTIPRRMVIGPNEQNSNSENFIAAMTRQGGANYNILTNRVWWDVK